MKTRLFSTAVFIGCAFIGFSCLADESEKIRKSFPFSELGQKATEKADSNSLGIKAVDNGAEITCKLQALEASVTPSGISFKSTSATKRGTFSMKVTGLSRADHKISQVSSEGNVKVSKDCVQIIRSELIEEFTVSGDGIRQDFIVSKKPTGNGEFALVLGLAGATAELSGSGIKIRLTEAGREFAYSKLLVTDASGKKLPSEFKVNSPDKFIVSVDDSNAIYPIRIDPTISDANWVSMGALEQGINSPANALACDSFGNLYVGGVFTTAGGVEANRIAKWDGSTWSVLGSGMDNQVSALACDSSGNLYAGGGFSTAGGVAANFIAKWNGSTWSALGSGMGRPVDALACDSSGNLYAGGYFTTAGGVAANYIAKWNGSTWSALGSGMDGGVGSLACDSSGNLYVGGSFATAGGVAANFIAKWNGAAWSALGSGMDSDVTSIACDSSGNLYAGGYFATAGGVAANCIAKWNGSTWSALGSGIDGNVYTMACDSFGNLYAGGYFYTAGGETASNVAKWNGSTWSALGSGTNEDVNALACDSSGNLYAGGSFTIAGGVAANRIAKWNGSTWSEVVGKSGIEGRVYSLACDSSGNLYSGGAFTTAGGVATNFIAKWNGSTWSALGAGTNQDVNALVCDSSGNLYAGGLFSTAGGVAASNIAKWNGSTWSALGSGMDESVNALACDSSGNLYAGGYFTTAGGVAASNIAKWNGSTWSALGSGMDSTVNTLACDSSGNLYAGGYFATAGGVSVNCIAKWNGSTWSALGSGMDNQVSALAFDSSGNLYAGGFFATAGGVSVNCIAKWNGSTWSALGSGMGSPVNTLACDSFGNLYAGGDFYTAAGGETASNIAKWDGATWSALGSGIDSTVNALAFDSSGDLYVGGWFNTAGGKVSPCLAKWLISAYPSSHTVTFIDGANGTINGTKIQTVNHGSNCSQVTAVPSNEYHFVNWTGALTSTANPLTVTNVTANMTLTANFAINQGVGLVVYYPLDGNANDRSGYGNNGTITGATLTSDRFGDSDKAYYFDNGSTDELVFGAYTRPSNNFSFGSWVKVSKTITVTAQATSGTYYDGQNFVFDPPQGGTNAGAGLSVGTNGIQVFEHGNLYICCLASYSGNVGTGWNHVFVVYKNKQATIYLNGVAVRTGLTSARANVFAPNLISKGGYGPFNGSVDEIKVYNRALSSAEALDLYNTPSVTASAGPNGSISPSGTIAVAYGSNKTFTISPAANCRLSDVLVDGTSVGAVTSYTFTDIRSSHTIAAVFTTNTYTLAYSAGLNGTLTGAASQTVNEGTNGTAVTAVPKSGYHFVKWSDDVMTASRSETNVMENKSVTATFARNTYTVNFVEGANGTITGMKIQTVNHGETCTQVTSVPVANYHFTGWSGDYTGVDNPLTLTNVASAKTIVANFERNTAMLTVRKRGSGTAGFTSVNPVNTVVAIPITANAYANNHFVNWTLAPGSASATIANAKSAATTVTLTCGYGSLVTIIANFAENSNTPTSFPAAPVVTATDGIYEDRIVVTWKAVATATSYEIYRNTTKLAPVPSDKIGEVTDTIFEDNTAAYRTTYFYFAKSKNSMGVSLKFSNGDSGYVAKAPSVPGAVTASDGTYFDKVRVSWVKVVGATSYLVFRTNTATPAPNPNLKTDLIGETTALFFDDFGDDIVPQVSGVVKKYYYWIAAKNGNATTVISKPNDGYLSNKGPATVTASNGTYSNRIVVTWTAVPGATEYEVYRYTNKSMTQGETKVGDSITVSCFSDAYADKDVPYYYRVKGKYGNYYDSAFSISGAIGMAAGWSNPSATGLANAETSSNIVNKPKGSSVYFSTEVPAGTTKLVATLDGTDKLKTNDCDLFAKFANYPTLALYNAKGVENNVNEILTVSNPAAGTWYFMLYGVTAYSDVTLTVNSYSVADIVLTQIPVNDLPVPFTAIFKGKVVDESGLGIPNMVVQTRNPITGLTSSLTKTDGKGIFSYSVLINSEGEHTFDFFFSEMPDPVKGTASHTVATRKGCFVEAPNNFFDFSAYLPATPVAVPLHADVIGLQDFLDTRNGWDENTINGTYATLWVNSTLAKARDDAQFTARLDEGLYILLYGVEGAGVGNDTTATPALSAVPFVVHVETSKKGPVLTALNTLGVINGTQRSAIEGGSIGIVAVTSLSDPDEGVTPVSISLLACEQLELLAKLAAGTGISSDAGTYSGVSARKVTISLANNRKINVVSAVFVKQK